MINNISAGTDVPNTINVIIEIPAHSEPVKYEVDKVTGVMSVDRFMSTSMRYPCEYGYIPNTLCDDGDPCDVLVISPFPLISGSVIEVRPIGVLKMTDENGIDVKILGVPTDRLTSIYSKIKTHEDLFPNLLNQITHFFEHYKDLEKDKWVKIEGWAGPAEAKKEIMKSIELYNKG